MPWRLKKTKRLNLHATITMTKIDHTIRPILTHTAPPTPPQKNTILLSGGEGIVHPPLPTLMSLKEEAKKSLLPQLHEMY